MYNPSKPLPIEVSASFWKKMHTFLFLLNTKANDQCLKNALLVL